MESNKTKRVNILVTPQQHKELKSFVADNETSIQKLFEDFLNQTLSKERIIKNLK
jgi:hypothetical protein